MKVGAHYFPDKTCRFCLWAPAKKKIELDIISPVKLRVSLRKKKRGYWYTELKNISPKSRYFYVLDGKKRLSDPASFFQPDGVHKASQIIDHNKFHWQDANYKPAPLESMIIYELHTGTFDKKGTFEGIADKLNYLTDLGINAIELMPVAQFPGARNWGYDGVYPFAVQNSYGGCAGLKKLVNACHKKNIAVILDVVYNHLGHEGNYLSYFGPYFSKKHQNPWGKEFNFDEEYSYAVREFFVQNALYWFEHYHIDVLRLDAIHGITDLSANHFLQELSLAVEKWSRKNKKKVYLIAESDLNDSKVVTPGKENGYGLDCQWNDDFHHSLHTLLTGDDKGYFGDFGKISHLAKAYEEGFVYSWNYSSFRKRFHGSSSEKIPACKFIVFAQNHDQIANGSCGERLSYLVDYERLKLSAGVVLLSPFVPMIFMGEEYGEENPFLYFTSFFDKNLIEAIKKGRQKEFSAFTCKGRLPDTQSYKTFEKSKLDWKKINSPKNKKLYKFYKHLIALRKKTPVLHYLTKKNLKTTIFEKQKCLVLERWLKKEKLLYFVNFSADDSTINYRLSGSYAKVVDSSQKKWLGKGSLLPEEIGNEKTLKIRGHSFALFEKK